MAGSSVSVDPWGAVRPALEELATGLGIFGPDLALIYCNKAFGALRDLPSGLCAPGTPLLHIVSHLAARGDYGPGSPSVLAQQRLAEIRRMEPWEVEQDTAEGRRLAISHTPVADGGLMIAYFDVSEARRLERKLREDEERYSLVSQAVAEGIYDWNVQANNLFVSARLIEIFGFTQAGLSSQDWYGLVHDEDRELYRNTLRDCFRGVTGKVHCEYRIKLHNGEYRWVEDHGLPIRDVSGRAIRLVGAVSDITQRKATEGALRESMLELKHALQQQTATAEVLKIISRSAFDLEPVLQTLVASATQLCEADRGVIFQLDGGVYRIAANAGFPPEAETYARANPLPPGRASVTGRVALEGRVVHIPDVLADPEYDSSGYLSAFGYRSNLGVPLLRQGTTIGVFVLTRDEVNPFTEKQIELVKTFADQAVIAIENVRLFDEVQARTRELSQSLEDLRKAQDRLVQSEKLASLGQLTAGIAHEIKNPLNFVNNFADLASELIDELRDLLGPAPLAESARAEFEDLTATIKGNLEKVVQHGRRADSIVKNMLLHSREGTGQRQSVDLNATVEESLNLAYHGARAEKPGFNVTLQKSFDPAVGKLDIFPQELVRVLLNLITNGFYAAQKKKAALTDKSFEPTLSVETRAQADRVEIRVRDNGMGIPAEVRDKIFNPFFTTKPAGEGTGLGLSLSHDIVVKQHGGTIEVATAPGEFTEFTVTLPRAGAPANEARAS